MRRKSPVRRKVLIARALVAVGAVAMVADVGGTLPRLHAQAGYGSENVTIATLSVRPPQFRRLDMVVVLDHGAGELSAYLLDPATRRFLVQYKRKEVYRDFDLPRTRVAKFGMITGWAEMRPLNGYQFAPGAIYITEETTGQMIAYGVPFSRSWRTDQVRRHLPLLPVDRVTFRQSPTPSASPETP
jgi:hypothetical protein